jgi:hypothetical protein
MDICLSIYLLRGMYIYLCTFYVYLGGSEPLPMPATYLYIYICMDICLSIYLLRGIYVYLYTFYIYLGGSEALPMAATLNWVVKDGLGQLGGVVFASVVSNRFDADPKR